MLPMFAMPPLFPGLPLSPWIPRPIHPSRPQGGDAPPTAADSTAGAQLMSDPGAAGAGGADATSGNSFNDNFLATLFMPPGAAGMKLPLVPSQPMISGLPGMAVRRANYFGPHWDTQVQARATAAAESLINSAQLLPQNSAHPSYPPGFPLRFGFSTTYPQVASVMNGGSSFV